MRARNISAALVLPIAFGCSRGATQSQSQPQAPASRSDYQVTIAGAPVRQGTVWLYYSAHQYFERLKIADVRDGAVRVLVSAQQVADGQPAPGDSGLTMLV